MKGARIKAILAPLVVMSLIVMSSMTAHADFIGTVQLEEVNVSPGTAMKVRFPHFTSGLRGAMNGVYNLYIENSGPVSGFCVEDALTTPGTYSICGLHSIDKDSK